VTLDNARRLLDEGMPLLEASLEVGMSGPGRLHDLFVTHEAMSPGDYKTRGAGLVIRWGFHLSPFGMALVMVTGRGLAGLSFSDAGGERAAFADMSGRWPNASFVEDMGDKPWFLHLSYVKPHWPYMAPAPYHKMYGAKDCLPLNRDERELVDQHPVLAAYRRNELGAVRDHQGVRSRASVGTE